MSFICLSLLPTVHIIQENTYASKELVFKYNYFTSDLCRVWPSQLAAFSSKTATAGDYREETSRNSEEVSEKKNKELKQRSDSSDLEEVLSAE